VQHRKASVQVEVEGTESRGQRYAKWSTAEKAHRRMQFMPLAQATGAADSRHSRKASIQSKQNKQEM